MRSRRKILLLFTAPVAALALWLLFKKEEPRHQGKTAREWFNAAGRNEVSESEYQKALEVLSTNFLPEFIAFGQGRHRASWFMRWLPSMPVSVSKRLFSPENTFRYGISTYEGMAFLGRSSNTKDSAPLLKESLRTTPFARQELMLGFYYAYVRGDKAIQMAELSEFSKKSEFAMRFCEAYYTRRLFGIANVRMKREELIPVLAEAITNSTLMTDIFGTNSENWQMAAYENLKVLSPETATNYERYIK